MADDKSSILDEFAEFLTAREEAAKNAQEDDDYEVEVWNEKGQGARLRRSHAKPFLQSLGIDVDPEPDSDSGKSGDGDAGTKGKTNKRTPSSGSNAASAGNVARRYFVKATQPGGK
jgi:hypothetical protein